MNKTTIARASALTFGAAVGLSWTLLGAGCHTVEGAGRDVSGIGRAVSGGAQEVRHETFGSDGYQTQGATFQGRRGWLD